MARCSNDSRQGKKVGISSKQLLLLPVRLFPVSGPHRGAAGVFLITVAKWGRKAGKDLGQRFLDSVTGESVDPAMLFRAGLNQCPYCWYLRLGSLDVQMSTVRPCLESYVCVETREQEKGVTRKATFYITNMSGNVILKLFSFFIAQLLIIYYFYY